MEEEPEHLYYDLPRSTACAGGDKLLRAKGVNIVLEE